MLKTLDIPSTPATTTAEWLTQVLKMSGVLAASDTVISLTVEPMNGVTGQMARLTPIYDAPASLKPTSYIAKYSHANPEFSKKFVGGNAAEINVYRELSEHISLPMPRCFFSNINMTTGQSLLLLEDLSRLRQNSFMQGFSLEQAETVVSYMARHHAQWWETPELHSIDYIGHITASADDDGWVRQYQQSWSRFEDVVMALMPDCYLPGTFLETGNRFGYQRTKIEEQIIRAPFTLLHHDIHPGNLMLGVNEDDPALMLIDWQQCAIGPGPRDLGYFLIISLPVSLRRKAEQQLVRSYYSILLENGVTHYSFEDCWRDYRLSLFKMLENLVNHVGIGHTDLKSSDAIATVNAIISRTASFAEDHCVVEFF